MSIQFHFEWKTQTVDVQFPNAAAVGLTGHAGMTGSRNSAAGMALVLPGLPTVAMDEEATRSR